MWHTHGPHQLVLLSCFCKWWGRIPLQDPANRADIPSNLLIWIRFIHAVPCHIFVHDMSPTIVPYMYFSLFFYYLFRIQDIWYLCTRVIYIQNLRWPCIDWTRFQSLEASHCGWAAKIAACLQGACAVHDIHSKIKRHQYTRSKNMSHTLCSCMYLNDICNYLILFCIVYFHIRMYSCIGSDMHIYIQVCMYCNIHICIFVFVYACCSRSSVGNDIPSHIWTTSKEHLNAHISHKTEWRFTSLSVLIQAAWLSL